MRPQRTPPPQSLTPALIKALLVVVKETVEGKVYTTIDVFNVIKPELTVGLGKIPRIGLHNLRFNSTSEDLIVLEPSPVPIASLGIK